MGPVQHKNLKANRGEYHRSLVSHAGVRFGRYGFAIEVEKMSLKNPLM